MVLDVSAQMVCLDSHVKPHQTTAATVSVQTAAGVKVKGSTTRVSVTLGTLEHFATLN